MAHKITTRHGRSIAYHQTKGEGPAAVFLGGFKSDMEGTKAIALEKWAKENGRAYLRFDYSGHGQSDGRFEDGIIGHWFEDACEIIKECTEGPQILIGSSMGGWISCLLMREIPERICGFIGIAAAPDFTEDSFLPSFSEQQLKDLNENGVIYLPSEYGDPYPISKNLIDDGRERLVLRRPMNFKIPIRLLWGSEDHVVSLTDQMKLFNNITTDDVRLNIVKGADHSFSRPQEIHLIQEMIQSIIQAHENK